jgi:hypothetical protein
LDNSELRDLLNLVVGWSSEGSSSGLISNLTTILGILRGKLEGNYLFSMFMDLDERNTTNYIIYVQYLLTAISLTRAND